MQTITGSIFQYIVLGANEKSTFDKKLDLLASLPEGWEYGDGVPASVEVVDRAQQWHDYALQNSMFIRFDAFASGGGDLLVAMYFRDFYIEIFLESDGNASLRALEGDKVLAERGPKRDLELRKDFQKVVGEICKSLDLSIRNIMTPHAENLNQLPFSNHLLSMETVQCLYSQETALSFAVSPFVNTSGNFILGEPESPQSSGNSTPPLSRRVAS